MPLKSYESKKGELFSVILEEVIRWESNLKHKNIYLFSRELTGAGKTTFLKKIIDYAQDKNFKTFYIKNLCSIDKGLKIGNNSSDNLNLVLRNVQGERNLLLCDEVKDKEFFDFLKDKNNFFIVTGYSPKEDIGNLRGWSLLELDGQMDKNQIFENLVYSFPLNRDLAKVVSNVVPNLGQGKICMEQFEKKEYDLYSVREFCDSLKTKDFWDKENISHELSLERTLDGKTLKIFGKKI